MVTDTPEMQAILQRIERLEAENRRLRRAALAVALAAVVALGMGQSQPSRTIEANRFVLTDNKGVKRAELALPGPNPALRFFDPDGRVASVLSAEGYSIFGKTVRFGVPMSRVNLGKSGLYFTDDHGEFVINLGGVAEENLKTGSPSPNLELYGGGEKLRAQLTALKDGARLTVNDGEGFSAELGNTGLETLRTGETRNRSAASLVLFGKDNKVLWSAP